MSEFESSADRTCPLTWPEQRRNLILFALSIGMNYLAAPVLYIGITHAALCEKLHADTATSNLPATMFFAMTAMVTLIAWVSPQVSALKFNLTVCYTCCAAILAGVALALWFEMPDRVKIAMVILQGAVVGAVMPAATAALWEAIGRGTDEKHRGLALAMAFGGGPVLAVIGSMCQSALLGGEFFFWTFPGVEYPKNFVILFAAGVPMMVLAILFGQLLIIPLPDREATREPMSHVLGLLIGVPSLFFTFVCLYLAGLPAGTMIDFGMVARWLGITEMASGPMGFPINSTLCQAVGLSLGLLATVSFIIQFRSILSQRTLLIATLVTILVYCGNMIPPNMNLYSEFALGDEPAKFAGVQNTLRFAFKMIAGLGLGWLLANTNPRAGMLATSCLFLLAMFWAMFVTGPAYLIGFGIFGAGELIGVYAPNYLVSASRKSDLRKTTAFMTLLMAPAAPVGYLYGSIVDLAKQQGWATLEMNSAVLGFRMSFLVCAGLILCGVVLALMMLPKHPRVER